MNKLFFAIVLVLTTMKCGFAQEDAEKCRDHSLLTRMPGYYISECTENFNALDFYDSKGQDIKFEGNLTYSWYVFNLESGKTEPSRLQIIKNYANAIVKIGGRKVYEEDGLGCYELNKNGKDYKIKVACTNNSDILLYVLEMEAMKQDITANEMLDALNKDGFIALNILFETGKSTIKDESFPVIDQVYELMKLDLTLKISIEGHTDNVGDAASNKKLSNDRAKAVMDALIVKGIDKTRISSTGWGQEKPVSDNRTAEGKAKNRRVEIIRK
ncbi:MAG: OmpA family protein [Bacteroidetes bacterium]|nr:OmpA family protein [Bacteroidota bacterium]